MGVNFCLTVERPGSEPMELRGKWDDLLSCTMEMASLWNLVFSYGFRAGDVEIPHQLTPQKVRHKSAWTLEEDEKLLKLVANGLTMEEVSKQLGRTSSACRRHWYRVRRDRGIVQ